MKTKRWGMVCLACLCHGCGIYSFSGVALSNQVKTYSVLPFYKEVASGSVDLAQDFTEALSTALAKATSLRRVPDNGDLQFSGSITAYQFNTASVTAAASNTSLDRSEQTFLTLRVQVDYNNLYSEEDDFAGRTFSARKAFATTTTLLEEEEAMVEEIVALIIEDILTHTIRKW